jgi:hypothetical protein
MLVSTMMLLVVFEDDTFDWKLKKLIMIIFFNPLHIRQITHYSAAAGPMVQQFLPMCIWLCKQTQAQKHVGYYLNNNIINIINYIIVITLFMYMYMHCLICKE